MLLTGLHTGHSAIRDNRQAKGFSEGQTPVPTGALQLPVLLKNRGYAVGGFGKWGLGPVGSTGDPLKQGFDRWFGYNCQAVAHNFYPTHLWDNEKRVALNNPKFAAHQKLPASVDANDPVSYTRYVGKDYAPDLIGEQARAFVRANKSRPFFLYYATTVPHLALQVPGDSLKEYAGKFVETPYRGDRGYLPQRQPRAAYAAMVTRLDRDVGRLLELLKDLRLDERTIVVFTSDNGPLYDQLGGTDSDFFDSAAGLRGRKGSFYEGGFRVPCLVRWPNRIKAGSSSDRVTGFEDWLPTLLELTGDKEATPAGRDGISFAPTLGGKKQERATVSISRIAGLRRAAVRACGRLESVATKSPSSPQGEGARAWGDRIVRPRPRSWREERRGGEASRHRRSPAARSWLPSTSSQPYSRCERSTRSNAARKVVTRSPALPATGRRADCRLRRCRAVGTSPRRRNSLARPG